MELHSILIFDMFTLTLTVIYVVLNYSCLKNANEEGSNRISSGMNILHDLISWQVTHFKKCECVCLSVCLWGVKWGVNVWVCMFVCLDDCASSVVQSRVRHICFFIFYSAAQLACVCVCVCVAIGTGKGAKQQTYIQTQTHIFVYTHGYKHFFLFVSATVIVQNIPTHMRTQHITQTSILLQ